MHLNAMTNSNIYYIVDTCITACNILYFINGANNVFPWTKLIYNHNREHCWSVCVVRMDVETARTSFTTPCTQWHLPRREGNGTFHRTQRFSGVECQDVEYLQFCTRSPFRPKHHNYYYIGLHRISNTWSLRTGKKLTTNLLKLISAPNNI